MKRIDVLTKRYGKTAHEDRPVLIPFTISAQGSSTPALALISALMVIAGGAVVAFPSRRRRPTFR